MSKTQKRKIIHIDEEKCDGCGLCVPACAEGAIQIIDGKAKLVSEVYCDGLGDCLGECPQGAISIVEREAAPFDQEAVEKHLANMSEKEGASGGNSNKKEENKEGAAVSPCCPPQELSPSGKTDEKEVYEEHEEQYSELSNWPVQLHLVPTEASFLRNPELLIAADCVPFAYAGFHRQILKDKALLVGCPKLDDTSAYLEKLTEIFKNNDIHSITMAVMEVPCCGGLVRLVQEAVQNSGKNIKLYKIVVSVDGSIREQSEV